MPAAGGTMGAFARMPMMVTLIGVASVSCGTSQKGTLPRGEDAGRPPVVEMTKSTEIAAGEKTATNPESEEASENHATAAASEMIVCEELRYRCYRPVTLDALVSGEVLPGRVAITMSPKNYLPCGPCPHGYHCNPCGETVMFTASDNAANDAPYLSVFSGELKKAPHRLFLCLDEGYKRHVNGHPRDPRGASIYLEGVIPVSKLSTHPEYRISEMPADGPAASCRPRFISSSTMTEQTAAASIVAVATIETVSPDDDILDSDKTYTVTLRIREPIRGTLPRDLMQCAYRVESHRRFLPIGDPVVVAISTSDEGCLLAGILRVFQRGMF